MSTSVTIIDYGMGNLFSVKRALERVGANPIITDNADGIRSASRLILPGVGAFGDCMDNLQRLDLIAPIQKAIAAGKPFLGICVGMQVLFDKGLEFGKHAGLGIFRGSVMRIPTDHKRKVPHIGWARLRLSPRLASSEPLEPLGLGGFYFCHSFSAKFYEESAAIAFADYQGYEICAAIRHDNVIGYQFHPERSGVAGLTLLRSFLESDRFLIAK